MWKIYILYIFFSISSPSSVAHVFHFFLLPCWLVIFAIQPRASLGKITDVFSEENSYSILYILFWLCLKFIFLLSFFKDFFNHNNILPFTKRLELWVELWMELCWFRVWVENQLELLLNWIWAFIWLISAKIIVFLL